jgi:hypothetical protein
MTESNTTGGVHVSVVSPEEAFNGNAEFWCGRELIEFWCGRELMAVTVIDDGRLQLSIGPRADGSPWLVDTTSLARGLAEAARLLAAY